MTVDVWGHHLKLVVYMKEVDDLRKHEIDIKLKKGCVFLAISFTKSQKNVFQTFMRFFLSALTSNLGSQQAFFTCNSGKALPIKSASKQ